MEIRETFPATEGPLVILTLLFRDDAKGRDGYQRALEASDGFRIWDATQRIVKDQWFSAAAAPAEPPAEPEP